MAIALVLISAFLHAAWNALLKREQRKDITLVAAVGVGGLLAAVVATVRALRTGVPPFATPPALGWALVAGAFEQLYFAGLARALDRGPLGPVYTISRGGAVVLVFPISIWLFHEPLTPLAAGGAGVVVLGLVLSDLRVGAGGMRAIPAAATTWAVICAFAIAAYHLAYKGALEAGGAPSAVFAASLAFSTLLSLARVGRTGRADVARFVRRSTAKVLLMGTLCGGSFLMLIEALATSGTGAALTLRNTSVLFATGLAWLIGEKPRVLSAIGACLVAAGAILMAL